MKIGTSFDDVSDAALAEVDSVLLGAGPTGGNKKHLQAVWTKLRNLKWMHSNMAGLDFFLFPDIVASNVTVTNSKGVYSRSLSEYALFACKYFALNMPRMIAQRQKKNWEQFSVRELSGQTMGIIGYGDIGQCTGELAKSYGMRVLGSRRNPHLSKGDPVVDEMYATDALHEMVSKSDYVVCAMPLTPETEGIVDSSLLAKMKSTAVLVNIGRGPCVDEAALIKALQDGTILGAGLDVFESEPLPESSPIWEMDNVLMSFHNADRVTGWLDNSIQLFVDNMRLYLEGKPLENVVDAKRGY